MLGILLAIVASLCFGTAAVFARLGMRHIKPSTGTFVSVVSSFMVVALLTLGWYRESLFSLSLMAALWFGIIGVLNFVIGRQCNYTATSYIGITRANPILSSSPLFAMIVATVFAGETVNVYIIAGTLCIVFGLVSLVTSNER